MPSKEKPPPKDDGGQARMIPEIPQVKVNEEKSNTKAILCSVGIVAAMVLLFVFI